MTYGEWKKNDIVDVYSLQRERVVPLLGGAKPFRPTNALSAAYSDEVPDYIRNSHLPAYTWMVEQFEHRTGRRLEGALAWAWLVYDPAAGRQHADEHLVHLRVPRIELLVSDHRIGWQHVLWGQPIVDPGPLGMSIAFQSEEEKRATWDRIFDIPDDTEIAAVQVVFDRIEPEWVTKIEALGPIQTT
jgi:hypothetical protein